MSAGPDHPGPADPPLRPVEQAIAGLRQGGLGPAGIADPLVVTDTPGWTPATALLDGSRLAELVDYPTARWNASTHASAILAWKAYTYRLAYPLLLGWASRRVPRLSAENILVRVSDRPPYVTVGLRTAAFTALDADDGARVAATSTVSGDGELLAALRVELLDRHLTPLAEAIRARAGVNARVLWGEVAAGLGRAADRTRSIRGGSADGDVRALLDALGVDHLVRFNTGRSGRLAVGRRTCCLAFTVPGLDGACGDCLTTPAASRRGSTRGPPRWSPRLAAMKEEHQY